MYWEMLYVLHVNRCIPCFAWCQDPKHTLLVHFITHTQTVVSLTLYLILSPPYGYGGGSRISRRGMDPLGGHGPLTQALCSENVCENERIGGMHQARSLDPPMLSVLKVKVIKTFHVRKGSKIVQSTIFSHF